MNRSEYAIIGGGIIGLATAWSLVRSGVQNVVVFEKENMPGLHATGKCAGGVRAQFSTAVNIELSKYSIDFFTSFEKEYQIPVDFHQHGYLFLLDSEEDLNRFQKNVELQREHGVDVRLIEVDEITKMQPHLNIEGLVGGAWCPTDGYGDPHGFLNGYATLCRQNQVAIELDCEVLNITHLDQDTKLLTTSRGEWEAEKVLFANGAWAAELFKKLGIEIPMQPFRRQIHVTKPFAGVQDPVPLTIDFGSGLYFHRESGGLLLGMADPEQGPGFDQSVNEDFMETIVMAALNRVPALETAELLSGWAGLYAITPDNHALMGQLSQTNQIYYATGFSGHGFMHAPAVGDCMAALMTGTSPPVDISPLALDRFQNGNVIEEFNVF